MGISMHWWRGLIWEWVGRSHVCLCKTILPFCYKELKCYIQILKGKAEWQDQKLGNAVHWLDFESKHSTKTGMQSISKRLGIFVANSAEHFKCIWQFQHLEVKRVTTFVLFSDKWYSTNFPSLGENDNLLALVTENFDHILASDTDGSTGDQWYPQDSIFIHLWTMLSSVFVPLSGRVFIHDGKIAASNSKVIFLSYPLSHVSRKNVFLSQ